MPFALPLAATAAAAAAPAAAAATASASLSATLVSVASQAAVSMAINAAMSVLSPKVGAAGRPVDWTLDPNGPIPFALGRVGVAGSAISKATFGPDKMNYGAVSVISGAGPIDGYESYTADDLLVTFDQNGKCVTPEWNGELFRVQSLGNQPDTWLRTPIGLKNNSVLPNWTASHRASGKALSFHVMVENSKGTAFPNGEIKPRIVLRGVKCWDPRKDSTYPGGNGPQRLNSPSTWAWSDNPAILALRWILGMWEDGVGKGAPHVGQQVGGIGSKLSGIDMPAYVAAANVCDTNGWTAAAYPNTDDDKHQVLVGLLQAAGAIYSQRAGKISLIQRASPKTSVATITANDVIGAIEIDTAASRIDRINTIQPQFWSPQHRWQMTALPEVTAQAYRDADGQKRSRGVTYAYVTNANQAAQLAALDIAHSREGMAGQVTLKPYLQRIQPGDTFVIDEPGFILDGLKCLCMSTEYDPAEAVVKVTFVSETDAKYPFALGQSTTPPTPPTLVAREPVSPPLPEDWEIVIRPPTQDGTQIPGFDLIGAVSNAMATAVIVEWGASATGPWVQAYSGPPTATRIELVGVQSGAVYYIAVRYQVNNQFSERAIYGPYTAPTLSAGIDQEALDEIRDEFDNLLGPIRDDIVAEADARQDAIAQEARDRAAALLAEAQARGEAIGEVQTKIDTVKTDLSTEVSTRQDAIAQEAADRAAALLAEAQARGEAIGEVQTKIDTVKTDLSTEVSTRQSAIASTLHAVGLAETSAKAYADDKVATASLNFVTTAALDGRLSSTLNSANSYADGKIATATQNFVTTAALDGRLSTTLNSANSYADGVKTYADQTFATVSAMNGSLSQTLIDAKSYADGKIADSRLTLATKTELNTAKSDTLISAKAYADDKVATASLNFVTTAALDGRLSSTLNSANSYADGKIATATQNFVTTAALDGRLSTTLNSANSYADGVKTYADQTFATVSAMNSSLSQTLIDAKSYADGKIADSRLTLATKTELNTAKSDTLISAKSYTDALRTDANQTFATQSSLNGVDSKATIAQQTAVAADGRAKALIGLETQVGGLITGIYSGNDGRIGSVRIAANHFSVETPGNPGDRLEFTGTTGLKIFKNGVRRIHIGFQ